MQGAPATAPAACAQDEPFPVIDGIDGQMAQRRFMGDRALFLRLLQGLREDHAGVVEVVRAEVEQGDLAQAAMRVHKLCGLAGNLSADALAGAAAQLEAALRQRHTEAIDSRLQAMSVALGTIMQALPAQVGANVQAPRAAVQGATAEHASPHHMAALLAAVETNDTSAVDHFEMLRAVLAQRHGTDAVARAGQAVHEFRFREASSMLRAWGYHGSGDEGCSDLEVQPVSLPGGTT
jgi:two-component system sensor histidine kinase/response regulator